MSPLPEDRSTQAPSTTTLKKKKKKRVMPPLLTELEKKNNALRLMIIKDRLAKFSVNTKLSLVEQEVLTKPLIQWEKQY